MLSLRDIEALERKVVSAANKTQKYKEKAENVVLAFVRSAEVVGTSFGMGVINGRWNSPEILGMPVDLSVGIAGHIAGLCNIAPDHTRAIGDGALSSWLNAIGAGIGAKMLRETQERAQQQQLPAQTAA